jgi:hypothetical protein
MRTAVAIAAAALVAGCGSKTKSDPGARGKAVLGGKPLAITGCVARRNPVVDDASQREWLASHGLTETKQETEVTLSIEDQALDQMVTVHALDLHFDPKRTDENQDGKLEVDFHAPDENSEALMLGRARCDWRGPVRGDAPDARRVTGSMSAHCANVSGMLTLDLDLDFDCPLADAARR